MVEGKLQREGEVTHVVVTRCFNMSGLLHSLTETKDGSSAVVTLSRADERDDGSHNTRDTRVKKVVQGDIFHGGRNFK